MRAQAAMVLVLLLAPLALAQQAPGAWSHSGGDAARSAVAAGLREPLDVVSMATLAPELAFAQWGGLALLPAGEGLVGVASARSGSSCALVRVDASGTLMD
ncbi:MAG TPA: hypothetical protein VM582_09030, partial [Candidatus Thermoplasmatota archaeon]|nr:hypothetical protein [Candidatus Thermoplasmatota archaeon]